MRPAVAAFCVAALAVACRRPSPSLDPEWGAEAPGTADRGDLCADVGSRRACWGRGLVAEAAGDVCLVERTLPARPEPKGGWRCAGFGKERRCVPRARGADSFSCAADRTCTQRRPRYPDDGEWECTEQTGAVICRGGIAAAGTVAGPADPGWLCGSGSPSLWGDRVCVDLSPDLPDQEQGWLCRFEGSGDERRVCVPSTAPRLGGSCDAVSACPPGSACVAGACLPPKPSPSCFVDSECASKRCLFGSCSEGVP